MALLLPSQSAILTAFAVLTGTSPGNIAFRDHQAFINTPGVGVNGYKAALEGYLATTSTASLATALITNLGLGASFTQAQAVAFLNANPGNRVGAMIDLSAQLYNYTGTDAGLLTARNAYASAIDGSYTYSVNAANTDQTPFPSLTTGTTIALKVGFDNVVGTAFADTFLARTIGNAATLNDGDQIDGGAGIDTVYVDFATSNGGLAITPVLKNIETVVIRAQGIPVDATNGNNIGGGTGGFANQNIVQIDAQRSLAVGVNDRVTADVGVTRWESNNSRSDVVIEDVRIGNAQKTKDVTIAMVSTDPGNVDFAVYFDQLSLRNSGGGTSTLTIRIIDSGAAAVNPLLPLLNNPYDTFRIGVNGVLQSINLNATPTATTAAAADTYAQLLAAFQASLAVSGTATAALGADFTIIDPLSNRPVTGKDIILTGTAGLTFSTPTGSGWFNTTGAAVPNNSNIYTFFDFGNTTITELVTSTVVLDDVGRGSTGGDLVIGGLSAGQTSTSRGVERFEITVNDNSKLQTINSTNNALREVTIKNGPTSSAPANAYEVLVKDAGKLTVNGDANQPGQQDGQNGNNLLPGVENNSPVGIHHGAGSAGFADVRLIDASAMTGDFAFTASVSQDSIAKYIVRGDTAASPTADIASAINANFTPAPGANGANFDYKGGAGNDTMVVTIDGGVAGSRSSIVSGQSDFTFVVDGGAGNDNITVNLKPVTTVNNGFDNWANNQDLNNNVTVNGGAGNDTIRTPGAGDITINAGDGNDTVYTDNTGRQTVADLNLSAVGFVPATLPTSATPTTTSNGRYVFNTLDQTNTFVGAGGPRNLNDIRSDVNNSYNFYKGTVTVAFKGIAAPAITLANAATYRTTDLEINQAIKQAINTDSVLNKLLVAQDGPGNTLIVSSLIDGVRAASELSVTFAVAPATTVYSAAEISGMALAYGNVALTTNALVLAAQTSPSVTRPADYATALAQDSAGVNVVGAASITSSDNFITPGSGDDVIVLGTTVGVSVAQSSNEVITYAAGFGNDTVVNFAVAGAGVDHLNFAAFLTGAVAQTATTAAIPAPAVTLGALGNVDNRITVVTADATNNTDALVTTSVRAVIDTAVQTAVTKQVFVVVNANNVGTVYSVTNGVAIGDAVVTREGTLSLADTPWASLTAANYLGVSATAEGASTATTVVVPPVVVPPAGNTIVVTAAAVTGTAAADNFTFDAAPARADLAGTNFQTTINGFTATGAAADRLTIDLPTANTAITTLAQLNGQQGVTVQLNPFASSALVNFGPDANGGELVTVTIVGVTDLASVLVSVI